jgi:hypothetical protein
MVVKWTSDKDQFVLNHLLTDSSIKINNDVLDAMIQTWRMYLPPSHSSFLFLCIITPPSLSLHHNFSFPFQIHMFLSLIFHLCTF